MINAYLAKFQAYVFAESPAAANDGVKKLRLLCQAMGFEPGAGLITKLPDDGLEHLVRAGLEKARLLDGADEHEQRRAVRGIASHFDGDMSFAEELVASIQANGGRLSKAAARSFSDAYKRPENEGRTP